MMMMMMTMIEHAVESLDCDSFSSSAHFSLLFFPSAARSRARAKGGGEEITAVGLIAHLIMS